MKLNSYLYCLLFFITLSNSLTVRGESLILDSLKSELSRDISDIQKIGLYNELFNEQYATSYEEALNYALKAYELAQKNEATKIKLSESANNVGVSYLLLDQYELSLKYLLIALKSAEELNDKAKISNSLYNIGALYDTKGEPEKGLEYTIKSANIDEEIGDLESSSISYSSIASYYFSIPDYDEGMLYYDKAMLIVSSLKDKSLLSTLYSNRALALKKLQRYEEALLLHKKEIAIDEQNGNKSGLETSYLNIADLYIKMGKTDKAIAYNLKSLNIALELNSIANIMLAYSGLAESYKLKGDITEAYNFIQLYSNWKDSLYNKENAKAIAEMQTKYNTEKKDAENKLLKIKTELDKTELDKKKNQQKMLILILALVLVVVFYVVYSLNQKKKTNKLLNVQNEEISLKNNIIEEKNRDITDSINYAERIQRAILPSKEILQNKFESFIFYKPKDIVSGDFYWVKEIGSKIFFAVVDCTGHGVPGAFMSIIGYHSLNKIVEDLKIEETGKILDALNKEVNKSLGLNANKEISIRDGMDISICCIDKDNNTLSYSGANNSLYLLRRKHHTIERIEHILENETTLFYEIKPNKMAIGGGNNQKSYLTHHFNLEKGDTVYLFSDGYADQFGGPKGKKFMYKPFKRMLLSFNDEPMENQKTLLDRTLLEWMGDIDQLDDICVMGVKF